MQDYIIEVNQRMIDDEKRKANNCIAEVRNFVNAYNELREEAEAMPETFEPMPQLTTELFREFIHSPDKIKEAYMATIAVPELAGGFKVKLDTLDIKHADCDSAMSAATFARNIINRQQADKNAYAIREQGTTAIISESWLSDLEERATKKAETDQEKALYDTTKTILQAVEDFEKAYPGQKIDLKKFEHAGIATGRPNFAEIFGQLKFYGRF